MEKNDLIIESNTLEEEKKNLDEIFSCINNKTNWCFDAGAGAGKTYALVETLKYIIKEDFNVLKTNNQKILCISYTNVAANEISKKIGNSDLVEVSTIHNCLWSIISKHQDALIVIHKNKLMNEISIKNEELGNELWAEKYRLLSDERKRKLETILIDKKDIYYKNKFKNSATFKKKMNELSSDFNDLLSNVSNFKKIADSILKINDFKDAISDIEEKKFKKVEYDYRHNYDRLDKMKISHDTLLEYSNSIIKSNDIIKQFFCDKYPFILVDEYQDTDELVIELLKYIDDFSKNIEHYFILGFFGDTKQNIYDKGVGRDFNKYFNHITRIKKEFNRRSSNQIINIANLIRNDDLRQKSIYSNFNDNDVLFFNILDGDEDKIVSYFVEQLGINNDNKLHCFELTNEKVAEKNGFDGIYLFFKSTNYYKKNYSLLSDQTLSTDLTKLGKVQMLIYRILDFYNTINYSKSSLNKIIDKNLFNGINLSQLQTFFEYLKNVNGKTLLETIIILFDNYKKGNSLFDKCIDSIFTSEIKNKDDLVIYLFENLFDYDEDEELDKENMNSIINFLNLDINLFKKWYRFINNTIENNVVYHTYHSTKGAEFKNVIVFLNENFGKKKNYFKNLLINLDNDDRDTDLISARNLLYVSLTRAINNLIVVYTSDIDEAIKNKIEKVFGKIKTIDDLNI